MEVLIFLLLIFVLTGVALIVLSLLISGLRNFKFDSKNNAKKGDKK